MQIHEHGYSMCMYTCTQDKHSNNEDAAFTDTVTFYNYMTVRELANLTTRTQSTQVHFWINAQVCHNNIITGMLLFKGEIF